MLDAEDGNAGEDELKVGFVNGEFFGPFWIVWFEDDLHVESEGRF